MSWLKTATKNLLRRFDIGLVRYSTLERLKKNEADAAVLRMLHAFPNEQAPNLLKYHTHSRSQIWQDLFVLTELNFKRNGYFVEFGATNGITLSNTHLMEKELGWTGILAEPARCWHNDLKKNRSANIETSCVWKDSHSTLTFNEVDYAELSTISAYSDADLHKEERKQSKSYQVTTISFNDLLAKYNAPQVIDYLSIDTEGSEYEILSNLDFSRHSFRVITCEHNFTPMREKIYDLLTKNGYARKCEELSEYDDWYVKSN